MELAVKSDSRKEALLEETRIAFSKERDFVRERSTKLDQDQASIDQLKQNLRLENLQLREVYDEEKFKYDELVNRLQIQQQFLEAKTKEADSWMTKYETANNQLKHTKLIKEQETESQKGTLEKKIEQI